MDYLWVKWVHILSATLLFGVGVGSAFYLLVASLGRNLHPQRFAGLRGKGWRVALTKAIEQHWPRRNAEGQFLLTFEIVYGHALRAPARHAVEADTRISLDEMKKMLRPE